VCDFLDTLSRKKVNIHGFALMRRGIVAAEGYWPPYDAGKFHRMYSVSKSFMAVAVGMMIDEGKLSLDDKAAGFFPEFIPADPSPHTLNATIRDLLMMATCNEYSMPSVEAFFNNNRPKHPPGVLFNYDTAATNTLCAIIEKLSGQTMIEYMRPRLLDIIGVSKDAFCLKTTEGWSWAGSAILATTRDFARFAQFCMNKGEWEGRQIVSRDYMHAATSRQIDNYVLNGEPELNYGYGYQFWCLRGGGFACVGIGGQLALCMPEHDTVLVTNGDTQSYSLQYEGIMEAYWRLLDRVDPGIDSLPENPGAHETLKQKIAELGWFLPEGETSSPRAAKEFSGKWYAMDNAGSNPLGILRARVDINGENNICAFIYEKTGGTCRIEFGMGKYIKQKFPELYDGPSGDPGRNYDCAASAVWGGEATLIGTVYITDDYVGTIKFHIAFKDDTICVAITKNDSVYLHGYEGIASGYIC
jgi:CubicO group peptidase (beta-lactamase class C family)